jgi:hypothetical protein
VKVRLAASAESAQTFSEARPSPAPPAARFVDQAARETLSATLTPSTAGGGAEGPTNPRWRRRPAPPPPGAACESPRSALPQETGRWSPSLPRHTRQGRYLDSFESLGGVATVT